MFSTMADLDYEGVWKETLIQLRTDLGEEEFGGWFSDLKFLRVDNNGIIIGISSNFHRDKLKTRYQKSIEKKLKSVSGQEITLGFEVTGKKTRTEPAAPLPKEKPVTAERPKPEKEKRGKHPAMSEDFTFDKFVVGENNNFAYNAAHAISRNPGKAYNPFLIFGGVGLGKTHLMQAIGNYIHENSDNKVIYITSEDFLNEYVNCVIQNKMNAFKNKFRNTDVLLIDDIQFFQDKERVQEELFHTFNSLYGAKKQLVFTCDRPVEDLKKLPERLKSRFELCLKVDLQPPKYEERCAILKSVVKDKNTSISDDVIDFISKNISSNVRELISVLNNLLAYAELMRKPMTLEIAQQRLKNALSSQRTANLSLENIIRVVAEYFTLTPNDLKGKKRSQNIVFPRQLAMYIGREMTDYSTTELGQDFGGRDHTTVMHSIDKIKAKLITDPSLESTIESIKRSIKEFSIKY